MVFLYSEMFGFLLVKLVCLIFFTLFLGGFKSSFGKMFDNPIEGNTKKCVSVESHGWKR